MAAIAVGVAASSARGPAAAPLAGGFTERVVASLSRWDGQLYLDIAREGYVSPPLHLRAAFFPLLPAAVRALSTLTGGAPRSLGLLLGNVADVAATCLLWRLACARLGRRRARHVLWAYALFPGRLFGLVLGTEGLFACLGIGAFAAAAAGRPASTWLAAALAGACRAPGAAVGLGLAVQVLADGHAAMARTATKPPGGRRLAALARSCVGAGAYVLAAFLGPAAFAAHLQAAIGRPWAFAEVQAAWRRSPSWPWTALFASAEPYDHVACWLGLLGAGFGLRRGAPVTAGERTFVLASLALPLCTGRLMSMQRFVAAAFPLAFVACALAHRPGLRRAYGWYGLAVGALLGFKLGFGHKVV